MKLESQPSSRRAGRPRDEAKREAILDKGWAMILERGLEATSLEQIARKAGVSRMTLYSHFADKSVLFEAAVAREMERLAVTQTPTIEGGSLRETLVRFGTGLMTFLTSPGPASYYNVLAGELRRHPALARQFFDQGPGVTLRNLATILRAASEKGEIDISSAEHDAERLIGMWQGLSAYRLALDLDREDLIKRIPASVNESVDLFLKAVMRPER